MDRTTVQLANWLSIGAAGLFAWKMIDLVVSNNLQYYLADQKFQGLVLVGGVMLAVIILLRIFGLVFGGSGHHHHHDHEHGHDHAHGDDDHSHAPSMWRLIVLALPLMIIFMGVPRQGFSAVGLTNKLSSADLQAMAAVSTTMPEGFEPKGPVQPADWKMLVAAASDPFQRERWQRQIVQIVGQAVSDSQYADRYRLIRVKITCCVADAVPLSITVLGKWDPSWESGGWVQVVGAVDFVELQDNSSGRRSYFPVIYQIQAEKTEARPYLQ